MDIFEKVKAIVVDQLGVDDEEIALETTFQSLNADSLDIVELVMALEEEFDIDIADEEVENIQSVGDIINYINANK
ncbi:Acyl carrier protein [Syntrophobotulus glycolicus DSM 8271]|uniref:Acyl carrier protein n=1 Tax=Syntrophobotulus glycolicus (strain DSM 8271 / FlGlyR) TaxID=645991 RepID=F0SUF1_SYNGF|nr:acyl carrier protein [Syntrophobotulus glycolicus]ADY56601.1 Acyl carrier protein [Syntrophobotulus glycolicus DSM 8271]